jgi:hypothetical protein
MLTHFAICRDRSHGPRWILSSCGDRVPVLVPRLATAASVRTLALVEVLFAQAISRFVFKQPISAREGIVMIIIGVVLLVWSY